MVRVLLVHDAIRDVRHSALALLFLLTNKILQVPLRKVEYVNPFESSFEKHWFKKKKEKSSFLYLLAVWRSSANPFLKDSAFQDFCFSTNPWHDRYFKHNLGGIKVVYDLVVECPPLDWQVVGSNPRSSHTNDSKNGTQSLPAWQSALGGCIGA